MSIFLVQKGENNGKELIDGVTAAVVEAADAGAAVAAANALDPRFEDDYFPAGSAVDIETPGDYSGGLFRTVVDFGVPP